MTATNNETNKKMPFNETDAYIDKLLKDATEQAIRQSPAKKARTIRMKVYSAVASAAVVLILFGIGWNYFHPTAAVKEKRLAIKSSTQSPLDNFLNNISDSEAEQIDCYVIEDIPEYY